MSREAADAALAKKKAIQAEKAAENAAAAAADRFDAVRDLAAGKGTSAGDLIAPRSIGRLVFDTERGEIHVGGAFAVDLVTAGIAAAALLLVVALVARRI